MEKEVLLQFEQAEREVVNEILSFGLSRPFEPECHFPDFGDGNYQLNDLTIKTSEELEQFVFNLPIFKKSYEIEGELKFFLEIGVDPDNMIPYINPSLYLTDELVIHNVSKYELNDLFQGFGFSLEENFYNKNEIFELTELGKNILSQTQYIIQFSA